MFANPNMSITGTNVSVTVDTDVSVSASVRNIASAQTWKCNYCVKAKHGSERETRDRYTKIV